MPSELADLIRKSPAGGGYVPPAGDVPAPAPGGTPADRMRLSPAGGDPSIADERVSVEQRLQSAVRMHAASGNNWETTGPDLARRFGVNAEAVRPQFEMAAARQRASAMDEPTGLYLIRRSIPGSSAFANWAMERELGKASARIAEGKAEPKDYDFVAQMERLKELDEKASTGGKIKSLVAQAPAFLGEAATGFGLAGRVAPKALGLVGRAAVATPAIPSSYAPQAVQLNAANGNDPDSWKGYATAVPMAVAQNAVLGSLQRFGNAAPGGLLGRSAAKGLIGAGEQAGVDVGGGLADQVLPDAFKTRTKFGTLGALAEGKTGDAVERIALESLTFGLFGAMHDAGPQRRPGGLPDVGPTARDRAKVLAEATKNFLDSFATRPEAAKSAESLHDRFRRLLTEDPAGAYDRMREQFADRKDAASRAYLDALRENVAKPVAEAAKPKPPEAPPKPEPSAEQGVGGVTVSPPTPSTSERPAGERVRLSEPNPLPVQKKTIGPVEALPTETQADMAKQLGVSVKELVKRQSEPLIAGLAGEAAKSPPAGLPPLPGAKTAPSAEVPVAANPERPTSDRRGERVQLPDGRFGTLSIDYGDGKAFVRPDGELWATGGRVFAVADLKPAEPLPPLPVAKPKTAFEQRNAVRSEQSQGSLLKVVRDHGGIDPTDAAFLDHYESKQRAIEDGIPAAAFKAGGRGLDQIAQELGPHDPTTGLKGGGYIPDADPGTVLRMLKEKTPHLHAEQPATHEKALEEYHRRMQEEADAAPKEPLSESDETGLTGDVGDFDFSHSENAAATLLASKIAENTPQGGVSTAMANQIPAAPLRPTLRAQIKDAATSFAHNVVDMARKLGGATAPKTSRLSAKTGDAIARFGTARVYATELAAHLVDRVMGKHTSDTVRRLVGGVITEMRLRHMRETFLEKGRLASNEGVAFKNAGKAKEAAEAFGRADEYGKKARGVVTIIGGKTHDDYLTNPLESEQSYQAALRDPVVKEVLARYKAEAVPVMEDAYRRAQGIVEGEEIDTETQLPGMPFTLKAVREGEAVPGAVMMGGRGNLANPKLFRIGASRAATGAATHGYDIDLGNIIENMAGQRVPAAAKAELYRTAEADGVGMWAKPGERPDPLTWKKIDRVAPPKGTQANADGATDFYVKLSAHGELRQVLAPDEPAMKLPGMAASTWAALVSTVEAASHTKNLLTQLTRPGMNPLDVIRSARDLIYRDPAAMREVVELARVGAMREHGADTGMLYGGKLDPTAWTGRFLTLVDRSMRLASGKAFDRLVERGWVKDTEGARRDFVNQIGNYSKRTQNRAVAWLRDTGVGPFATAATNFAIHGLRSALIRPGVKGQTWKADLKLRAEMLGRLALLPAVAAITNYVTTGRVDGDDNTPVGAMWLGKSDGKTSYLDLTALTGLSRGWRETGMLAMAEGMRPGAKAAGATPGTSADKAVKDIARSALHPAFGPPVAFGHTAITGENIFGTPVANRAAKGESQAANNALAAFWSSNPLLEAWIKPAVEELAETRKTPGQVRREGTAGERFMKTFGPFGLKTGRQPPGKPMPK